MLYAMLNKKIYLYLAFVNGECNGSVETLLTAEDGGTISKLLRKKNEVSTAISSQDFTIMFSLDKGLASIIPTAQQH